MKRNKLARALVVTAMVFSIVPAGHMAGAQTIDGCAGTPSAGGDWPSYGHDLSNTRSQELETTISPANAASLSVAWTFAASALGGTGTILGTPVEADGCVFVGTDTGWVFALNADSGAMVWRTKLATGVFSSLAVSDGKVFANESITSEPYTVGPRVTALDEETGAQVWETIVSDFPGSDLYASPSIYDGMVITGVGANSIEGNPNFRGSIVFLDADSGAIIRRTWTIPPEVWHLGYSGAGIWGTPVFDTARGYAYTGTGNPFNSAGEYGTTNAIIKIDVDRSRPTFGDIVGTYKGQQDQFVATERTTCQVNDSTEVGSGFAGSRFWTCEMLDVDFGASPNLFRTSTGRVLVGAFQKSGTYHAVDPETMEVVWTARNLAPPAQGGNAAGSAFDDASVYVATDGGRVYALDTDTGVQRWAAGTSAAGSHYQPVSVANGVVYGQSSTGGFYALDAAGGATLLDTQMGNSTLTCSSAQVGGIAVARNTVYTTCGSASDGGGVIFAYRA